MLVVTRRENETIRVGDVVFTVMRTGPSRVKIGIEAPLNVRILRGELDPFDPPAERRDEQGPNDERSYP